MTDLRKGIWIFPGISHETPAWISQNFWKNDYTSKTTSNEIVPVPLIIRLDGVSEIFSVRYVRWCHDFTLMNCVICTLHDFLLLLFSKRTFHASNLNKTDLYRNKLTTNPVKPNIEHDTDLICNIEWFSWAYPHEENQHRIAILSISRWRPSSLLPKSESGIVAHLSGVQVLLSYEFFQIFFTCEFFKGWKTWKIDIDKSRLPIIHKPHVSNHHSMLFLLMKEWILFIGFCFENWTSWVSDQDFPVWNHCFVSDSTQENQIALRQN